MEDQVNKVSEWAIGRLAAKHYANGEFVFAECLSKGIDTSFYSNEGKMNDIVAFMHKDKKSAYESFVIRHCWYSPHDVYDYQGVVALRKEDIAEAISKFALSWKEFELYKKKTNNQNPETYISPRLDSSANPFMTYINERDQREWLAMKGKVPFTKLSFSQKLAELFTRIENQPTKAAETYFEIAAAFYNISLFGNSRHLYETKIKPYGYISMEYGLRAGDPPVVSCSTAKKYFHKALLAATDIELKARCNFMLARCEQNEFYINKPAGYNGDFRAGKYFKTLKSDYIHTQYFQEILKECGYFRTFCKHD
ncbi:MAG: hypothetical protein HYV28_12745 [Ignavibacteriales bacterium]|nr:hypothetical protein [Ignavibacteriales bacterium]